MPALYGVTSFWARRSGSLMCVYIYYAFYIYFGDIYLSKDLEVDVFVGVTLFLGDCGFIPSYYFQSLENIWES